MSIAGDIQKLDPGSIVELFELDLAPFGGSLLRFHAGINTAVANVVWQGNTYTRYPIQAEGFEFTGKGQLPRPTLRVSNAGSALTAFIALYNDLVSAKVTRHRTFVKYLDGDNFPNSGVSLSGASGTYISTPDSAAISITGDIDLRAKLTATDWTPAALQEVLAKNDSDSSQFSYLLRLEATGALSLYWSVDGTTLISKTSTAVVSFANGTPGWVRATLDVNNGASGNDVKFYTSLDGVTWTQLGTTVTTAGVTSIFNATSSLRLGARGTGGTGNPFNGKIFYAEIRNGLAGTVVAKFDPFNDAKTGVSPFTSSTGEVWTLNGAAAFTIGHNPLADPTAAFVDDVFYIDRKANENKNVIEFELASVLDLAGKKLPRRQIIQNICPWKYRSAECSYAGPAVAKIDDSVIVKYLSLPAIAANNASTPDSAANSITGDIDIRLQVAATDWTPAGFQLLLSKWFSSQATSSYKFYLDTGSSGKLGYQWSDGTAYGAAILSSVATGFTDGTIHWVRVTHDVNNGAGGNDVRFFTSTDGLVWTQLGTTITTAGVTSIGNSTSSVLLGEHFTGSSFPFLGKIYYADIRNAIDASAPVVKFDAKDSLTPSSPTVVSILTGETWTVNTSGGTPAVLFWSGVVADDVCGKRLASCKLRFGETAELPYGGFPAAGLVRS